MMAKKKKSVKAKPIAIITSTGEVITDLAIKQSLSRRKGDPFTDYYSTENLVIPPYNLDTLANLCELNVYHNIAIRVKVLDIVGQGWGLNPIKDNPSEEQRQKILAFFNNQSESLENILEKTWMDFEATGCGYMEVVREGYEPDGEIVSIHHLPSKTIRVKHRKEAYCQFKGGKSFVWFKPFGADYDIDCDTGNRVELKSLPPESRATEIIAFMNYSPLSQHYGIPDILPSIGALQGWISQRDFNLNFFETYGVPSYMVSISGDYDLGEPDDKGEYAIVKLIKEHLKKLKENPHSPLIVAIPSSTPDGKVEIKFEPVSTDIKEGHFENFRKACRDEILSAHAVSPYRLGIAEIGNLGGTTAKENNETYYANIVKPRQRLVCEQMNRLLRDGLGITDWELYLETSEPKVVQEEIKVAKFLFECGAMTPNQLIEVFGKDWFGVERVEDVPAMDWHYIGGKPIEAGGIIGEDVESGLKSLTEQLTLIVKKLMDYE